MNCTQCGNPIDNGSAWCSNCGEKVERDNAQQPAAQFNQPVSQTQQFAVNLSLIHISEPTRPY